jgi:hypothetical protein
MFSVSDSISAAWLTGVIDVIILRCAEARALPAFARSAATSTITDACACIGGNSISFARSFMHVNSLVGSQHRSVCSLYKHLSLVVYAGDG